MTTRMKSLKKADKAAITAKETTTPSAKQPGKTSVDERLLIRSAVPAARFSSANTSRWPASHST